MYKRIANQFEGFMSTPSILKNSNFAGFTIFKSLDKVSSTSSKELLEKDYPENLVLGKRVEFFFLSAINASQELQIIAHNIQINDENRTLGELDFIVRDLQTSEILHIELMYKFYVYDPEIPNEMERWIGPNRKDSLLQKINKVKKNQFPILHTPQAENHIKDIGIDSKGILQQICFKAALFIPEKLNTYNFPNINEECIIGFWLHLKDFSKYNQKDFQFFAPEKQDWPMDPEYGEKWFSFEDISEQIQKLHLRNKSPLIWIKKPDGTFERLIAVWW
ncbi:hypothetical protein JM83_3545 [Gillisia sp. Hel_I_86]|uniref:DUF1853 family protein n=1 Tax=Gillisia sp. Hel_I_86 TaxID=1249981 RepID=UPI00119B24A2|nr:DUF1853 family protein [Gillisia sp. Hel_I_86]TVZ28419.1 hypothetical protein JM83_3545 [Gillisia sp. Hel_I_86]